jgi:hypothetical protein
MLLVKHRVPCETQHTDETAEALRARLSNEGIRVPVQADGKRRAVQHGGKLCSRCLSNPPKPHQRYCSECLAAANREYRGRVKAKNEAIRAKLAAYESAMP